MALTKVSRGLLSTGIVDNSNATAITIDSSENVGIGTGSPAATYSRNLQIDGTASAGLRFTSTSYTSGFHVVLSSGDADLLNRNLTALILSTNATELMRIDSLGNVGIAVTPPAWGSAYANVNVGTAASFWGSKTGASLVAMSDNSYFNGSAYIARNTGAGSKYYQNAGGHYWDNATSVSAGAAQTNVERMRIDSSGSLLVGKTVTGLI